MTIPNSHMYNNPTTGQPSSIGPQLRTDYYVKKALIELKKEQYFTQLADTMAMPKHHGKTIKQYVYIPLLDDRNINDQGIDAKGVKSVNGNLYGSSKDIGTIPGKFPVLSETGGRVNRVGFTRKQIEGTFAKYGFFTEYTQESLDFDTDAELLSHVYYGVLHAANQKNEDTLQIDLINAARTLRYPGAATQISNISESTVVTFKDLVDLARDLDDARTPKHTTVITGSRLTDTRTIPGARVLYIGSELEYTLRKMKDFHDNPAFIPVEKYADAGTTLTGEIGSIHQFRVVVVPEMMKWAGAGATASGGKHYETNGKVDVFPMLVVGDKSFTTIAFKTDGKSNKFIMKHKKPGEATREDPYGETGLMSIKWYYGFMALRPERIGLIKTAAEM